MQYTCFYKQLHLITSASITYDAMNVQCESCLAIAYSIHFQPQFNILIYILYYFNIVEAIISHQKLRLTCRELRSSCTACTSIKAIVIFAVNSSSMLIGKIFSWKIRHEITFWGRKPYKKNIESYQNFTGFYKKGVEALNKLQNP